MSCKETATLVADYLDAALPALQRENLERHVQQCVYCRDELASAQDVAGHLRQWRDQAVPQWNRIPESLRTDRSPRVRTSWFSWWQWAPTAIAFVLVLAVFYDARLSSSQDGFVLAFGGDGGMDQEALAEQLALFEARQRLNQEQEWQALIARMEERQDRNNVLLMENVVARMGESTARSLDQVIAYFEAQREQDMQILQSTYQQLADSDYQTLRSVQQLASYVQYQP